MFRGRVLAVLCLLASCASKKTLVEEPATVATKSETGSVSPAVQKLTFVQKVYDNQVYTKNIVGDMSFHIQSGKKDITVPGALRMRKDEVIRIQLFIPVLRTEVVRLEFTPDYVLIVDRMHKEYIKADYNQVSFLRNQGISFYSLQAIFWNQLLLPGVDTVKESDLKKFDVDFAATGDNLPISYQQGAMTYSWQADKVTGRIMQTLVDYKSNGRGNSSLRMNYTGFKSVGVKCFPSELSLNLMTTATESQKTVTIDLSMDKIKTDSNWDAQTEVSSKYKKVEPQDVLDKIMNL